VKARLAYIHDQAWQYDFLRALGEHRRPSTPQIVIMTSSIGKEPS